MLSLRSGDRGNRTMWDGEGGLPNETVKSSAVKGKGCYAVKLITLHFLYLLEKDLIGDF